jgi:hypothetical protein
MKLNITVETDGVNDPVIISYPPGLTVPPATQYTDSNKKTVFENVLTGAEITPGEDTSIRVITTTIEDI